MLIIAYLLKREHTNNHTIILVSNEKKWEMRVGKNELGIYSIRLKINT